MFRIKPRQITMALLLSIAASCNSSRNNEANSASKGTAIPATTIRTRNNRALKLCTADLPQRQKQQLNDIILGTIANTRFAGVTAKTIARAQAITLNNSNWRKQTVNVIFLGGDQRVKDRVKKTARQWEPIAHVKFNFDQNAADTDIAISFVPRIGTFSQIGKFSKGCVPSMNYDDLEPDDDDYYYNYYVLHEFGHALGLEHEHQSYNATIIWNVPALISYCTVMYDPPWDSTKIYDNIIDRFHREMTKATRFDPTSIMMYTFPDSLVLSGYVPQRPNTKISTLDAQRIAALYNAFAPGTRRTSSHN